MYFLAVYYLNTYGGAECYCCCDKNYVPKYSIYKMLLIDGTKQQEPAVLWPPALAILLKKSPQALFFLHGREQFGSPLPLVGIFVAGDDPLECRDG